MKPTPQERLDVYRKALETLKAYRGKDRSEGMCFLMPPDGKSIADTQKQYPELFPLLRRLKYWYKNGDSANHYWFSLDEKGNEKRIALLEEAIAKVQAKL